MSSSAPRRAWRKPRPPPLIPWPVRHSLTPLDGLSAREQRAERLADTYSRGRNEWRALRNKALVELGSEYRAGRAKALADMLHYLDGRFLTPVEGRATPYQDGEGAMHDLIRRMIEDLHAKASK